MSPLFSRRTVPGADARAAAADATGSAVVFQAAALLLAYPEADLIENLDVIEAALGDAAAAEHFRPVLTHLRSQTLREAQSFHVQEFDLSRRHALHLSYWTDGDTRRRGEVLADIKGVFRDSGLLGDLQGELPDYLPIMLEFAVADPDRGQGQLQRFRASLELLRIGLAEDHLPHAGILTAICNLLPGDSPKSRVEVQAMVDEVAPLEFVGLSEVVRR